MNTTINISNNRDMINDRTTISWYLKYMKYNISSTVYWWKETVPYHRCQWQNTEYITCTTVKNYQVPYHMTVKKYQVLYQMCEWKTTKYLITWQWKIPGTIQMYKWKNTRYLIIWQWKNTKYLFTWQWKTTKYHIKCEWKSNKYLITWQWKKYQVPYHMAEKILGTISQ